MRQRRGFILAIVGVLGLTACGGDFAGDGKAAFEQGKYREAVEFLQVALSEDPDDAQGRFYLGVALNRDRTADAIEAQTAMIGEIQDGQRALVEAAGRPVVIDAEVRASLADVPVQCLREMGGSPLSVHCAWATSSGGCTADLRLGRFPTRPSRTADQSQWRGGMPGSPLGG